MAYYEAVAAQCGERRGIGEGDVARFGAGVEARAHAASIESALQHDHGLGCVEHVHVAAHERHVLATPMQESAEALQRGIGFRVLARDAVREMSSRNR